MGLVEQKLYGHRRTDRNKGLYDEKKHIDFLHIRDLRIVQKNLCYYCNIYMVDLHKKNEMFSIDRIDNKQGHNKDNCILACWRCNSYRGNDFTCDEFYEKQKLLRIFNKFRQNRKVSEYQRPTYIKIDNGEDYFMSLKIIDNRLIPRLYHINQFPKRKKRKLNIMKIDLN
jgi:hypothetical protein